MVDKNDNPRINLGYVVEQLARALRNFGGTASSRVDKWRQVLGGILGGTLDVGSRTPVSGIPPWVTLDVVHGGFATGGFAAGGPLQPHEIAGLQSVAPIEGASHRALLNEYYATGTGRDELAARLQDGRFRVRVPEESALLVVIWLMRSGERDRAQRLIGEIRPFFDRLRFYSVPSDRALRLGTSVHLQTVADSAASLSAKRSQKSVERMKEAIQVWLPLYDRAVSLFLETVEGDTPSLRTDASGALARQAGGCTIVEGGWPARRFAHDWRERARATLAEYRTQRSEHSRCGKPERPKENFARLRVYLEKCAKAPESLVGRDVGMIRRILASYVTRHGMPGGPGLAAVRAEQRKNAAKPTHQALAQVLAKRLQDLAPDEGAPDLQTRLGPLTADEALALGTSVDMPFPESLLQKARRCTEAPIEALVQSGLVRSSETLARVLPMMTAGIRAAGIKDPDLRRLYHANYLAFRRRRSLLLVDLQRQVKLDELPWVNAVRPWVGAEDEHRVAAREALVKTVKHAVEAFPQTILPNKLVRELRGLAADAGEHLPLVEELAADIFMGAFASSFLRAAQAAGRLLQGTLYERYYGLPYARVLALDDIEKQRFGAPSSPGFAGICRELAGPGDGRRWSPARNGTIIEQAQILTTHNLAVLFDGLGLLPLLRAELALLARRNFEWMCDRLQARTTAWRAQMQNVKNAAYAWRQALFFQSLLEAPEASAFSEWCQAHLMERDATLRQRVTPVVAGLAAVVSGAEFASDGRHEASGGRRLLGWSVGRHWLLGQRSAAERAS
jgi:hypothetical protein